MGKMIFSQALQDILKSAGDAEIYSDMFDMFDAIREVADSSCVTDHDTDAFVIFENGFELAMSVKTGSVFHATDNNGITYFFIGDDEAEVVTRLGAAVEAAKSAS